MYFKCALILILSCLVGNSPASVVPPPSQPSTQPPSSTTLSPPTSTVRSTTATAPNTTVAPTTTTAAPNSTTASPTTTTSPSQNTTAVPTTTPTPKPTVQPSTTVAPPTQGTWTVTNSTTNFTCIVAQMAVQLNISYPINENTTGIMVLDLPQNGTSVATGDCGDFVQNITISWPDNNKFTILFAKNDSTNHFDVKSLLFSINATTFPKIRNDSKMMELSLVKDVFVTPYKMSYKCNKEQVFNLTHTNGNGTGVSFIRVSHLQLEAFRKDHSSVFAEAEDCEAVETPDIVPIAVGCALAALVIIVLAAYLIGRRRAQNRGYLSIDSQNSD